ncbi:MAG TPA: SGNH/GDSL hydrolase family protein [Smithella sp.]|nr:SGNH/GDSL hydrolase family protein [Smithella sp.]HPR15976.1 SGNH/GDSL hydrolase family protein [Smithella sp.]HQC19429.1 SGNH/GDSL hydrolase family protein [Smithella sp.]
MSKILLKILTNMLLLVSVFILPSFYPAGPAVYFRLFLLTVILILSVNLFKVLFIDRNIPKIIANTATVCMAVFVTFIVLEAAFMFIPRSHSADYTLASKLWYAKYWKPINSMGFRDKEPAKSNHVILFVGDSFTAGHGLKSVDERFSDIVAKKLNKKKNDFTVMNIAKPNLDSREEYDTMMHVLYLNRIKPEKIILQYCGNDIEGAAARHGLIFEGFKPPSDMNRFLLLVGSGSYFFNYVYFLFPREYLGIPYLTYLDTAYKNNKVLSDHKKDLMLFIDYARKNSIQIIAVVFPFLADLAMSDAMYVNDITGFLESNGTNVINVSSLTANMPIPERIVNKNDGHASAKVNRMVAVEILKIMDGQNESHSSLSER